MRYTVVSRRGVVVECEADRPVEVGNETHLVRNEGERAITVAIFKANEVYAWWTDGKARVVQPPSPAMPLAGEAASLCKACNGSGWEPDLPAGVEGYCRPCNGSGLATCPQQCDICGLPRG